MLPLCALLIGAVLITSAHTSTVRPTPENPLVPKLHWIASARRWKAATSLEEVGRKPSHYRSAFDDNDSIDMKDRNNYVRIERLNYTRKMSRDFASHSSASHYPFPLPYGQVAGRWSCRDQCDTTGYRPNRPCQCNPACVKHEDCCFDYTDSCLTCKGRCDLDFDDDLPCQCNPACGKHNDCCDDANRVCGIMGIHSATVTDIDLATFSEDILSNDVNNCGSLVTLNTQGTTCFSCKKDAAPAPLLTVQTEAYRKPTIAKLLPLYNNYVSATGVAETVTNEETQEEAAFLGALLGTPAMTKAEKFLTDKGFIPSNRRRSGTNTAFRDALSQIWFGFYSRENRTLGSSGFEHVFLGEVKDGKVSGFHNWVFFSKEEASNKLNYKGRIGTVIDLGPKGKILKHKFDWNSKEKPISSMFVGTSPEFEMALYTVCYYSRPGGRCPVKLGGKNVNIQTHYMNRQGKRYVASAYPDV